MNYKLKLIIVWFAVSIVATINLFFFGWMFRDFFYSFFQRNTPYTIDEINDRYLLESFLQPEIVDALNTLYDRNSKRSAVFAIDHNILTKYLPEHQLKLLVRRGYLQSDALAIRVDERKQSFVTFGIFYSKLRFLKKKLAHLVSIGWEVKVVSATGKYAHTIDPVEPLHFFLNKNFAIIQLVVFYKRQNYHWIGAIRDRAAAELYAESWWKAQDLNLTFGTYEAIYDRVDNLVYHSVLAMPHNIVRFIMQYRTAQFIENDYRQLRRFETMHSDLVYHSVHHNYHHDDYDDDNNHDDDDVEPEARRWAFESTINTIDRLSRHWLYADISLFNGALLSWGQNGGPRKRMQSMDFMIDHEQVTDMNLTAKIINFFAHEQDRLNDKSRFSIETFVGKQESGIEYRMLFDRVRYGKSIHTLVRLVTGRHDGDESIGTSHYYTKRFAITTTVPSGQLIVAVYRYPRSEICSADYMGKKVLVPCLAFETIISEFGQNWRVPIDEWDSLFSPHNLVNRSMIPKQSIPHFYQLVESDEPKNGSTMTSYDIYFYFSVLFVLIAFMSIRLRRWWERKKQQ